MVALNDSDYEFITSSFPVLPSPTRRKDRVLVHKRIAFRGEGVKVSVPPSGHAPAQNNQILAIHAHIQHIFDISRDLYTQMIVVVRGFKWPYFDDHLCR